MPEGLVFLWILQFILYFIINTFIKHTTSDKLSVHKIEPLGAVSLSPEIQKANEIGSSKL